jgi:hypothetical protein
VKKGNEGNEEMHHREHREHRGLVYLASFMDFSQARKIIETTPRAKPL